MNDISTTAVLSPPAAAERRPSAPRRFARRLPTLLILAALGALAYFGHQSGWKLPKLSALSANGAAERADWCDAHSVPESQCVECQPDLMPRGRAYGWCAKHGVHECPLCHPDVAQVKGKPQLPKSDVAAALKLTDRSENKPGCKLNERRIQFVSDEAAKKAGLGVEVAAEGPMTEVVSAYGEITYDQTRVARLSSRVPGTVWRVEKQVGDAVKQGEVLALIDAAEVGRAKSEFAQALVQYRLRQRTHDSLRRAAGTGAVPERQMQESEAAVSEARIRLLAAQQALVNLGLPAASDELLALPEERIAAAVQFLGLPADLTATLDPKTTTANLIPLKAPLDGVIVSREVVAGEVVDAAKVLFVAADPRRMWLNLHVRLEDVKHLALGQPVRFRPDGGGPDATGQLAWISTAVDEKTRTVKVRADLANADGRLRANTFGTGAIVLREEKYAVVVPKEAVHWEGCCHIVFVRDRDYLKKDAPKVFHTRTVRVGATDAERVEVLAGVLPGEVVASKGSAALRAELLKNNLGAG